MFLQNDFLRIRRWTNSQNILSLEAWLRPAPEEKHNYTEQFADERDRMPESAFHSLNALNFVEPLAAVQYS
jgi:hypothetical protein